MLCRDGGLAKELYFSKLCTISLHVLCTSLVSVYVNYSHCTAMLFFEAFSCYHDYLFSIISLCSQ